MPGPIFIYPGEAFLKGKEDSIKGWYRGKLRTENYKLLLAGNSSV